MVSLLEELLHDVARRAGEIERELAHCRQTVPAEVESYRADMEQRACRARLVAEQILADPDMGHPLLALTRRICQEVNFPYPAPICSSLSSQYYWTVAGMDLIFLPSLEPDRLLGLADLYHELGHIVLYREERRLRIPGLAIVDRHFDRLLREGRHASWPAESLRELETYRHHWRSAWLLEFGADLIASYLIGSSFGWCNIRTSTNLGGELFHGNDSHPADDARATAIDCMLRRLGELDSAAQIRNRWSELVQLSGESVPPRYDAAYPQDLIQDLCELVFTTCHSLGLTPWDAVNQATTTIGATLREAWNEFRQRPDSFGGHERQLLRNLLGDSI